MHQTNPGLNGGQLHMSEVGTDLMVGGYLERYDWLEQHSANVDTGSTLIRSKLSQPRICRDMIPRTRLIECLNAGLSSKLTLLSAPAGFGKTTLLVEWLKTNACRSAWLSLDENDNEPRAFMHYLVAALQTVFPNVCKATASLLNASQFPSPDRLATLFTNDLADIPEDVILVLDNYHTIHHKAIHTLLDLLVRYMPPQVHLVLTTRSEPPLPLAEWRAQGQLNELYGSSLRFTHDETQAFLTSVLGDELAHEAIETLEKQTEGWIAMLRHAALSLHGASDHATFMQHLRPDYSMSSYLMENFLAQHPQVVQQSFLRVSILDQFCPALCEAIIASDDPHDNGQAYLNWLERSDMFVAPLDERQGWYRFHPLFKLFLEQRLQECVSKEEIAVLHRRASTWYAAQGWIEEAIKHALAAGDAAQASHLVEAQFLQAIEREQWMQLERWLHLLPEEQIKSSPGLLVASAWLLEVRGQLEGIAPLLTAAEHLLATRSSDVIDEDDPQVKVLPALIALLWSLLQYTTGQAQASLANTRCALELIAPGELYLADLALHYQALSSQLVGHEDLAHFELDHALREQPPNLSGMARLLFAQAFIYLNAGKLQQVEQTAQHLLRLAQEANLPISQSWAHWLLGYVQYEWNRLDMAAYHFSTVIANPQRVHQWSVREAMYGLALVYQAQGLHNQTRETMDALLESLQGQNNICALSEAYCLQGYLALLQDEVESAEQWVELGCEPTIRGAMTSFAVPPITKARLLLARGDEQSVVQGQELLSTLLCHVESIHNTRKAIQVLALQALAYDLRGHLTEALDVLERSIVLAYPGGFIRTFADLPRLAKLLQELRKRRKTNQTIERRLDAYLQSLLMAMSAMGLPADSKEELMRQKGLEPLTDRELQILHLLDKDLTNKEIAHELVITAGTVKVHTINVYRKLSASNRREAVALSKSLGLLADS